MKKMFYAREKADAYRLIGYLAENEDEAYKRWEDGEEPDDGGDFEIGEDFDLVSEFKSKC